MSARRFLALVLLWLGAGSVGVAQTPSSTQPGALTRALDLETAGKWREAGLAFREALLSSAVPALLGLERVYSQVGMLDSLVPTLETLVLERPREPVFRTVQLRVLTALGRFDAAAKAFEVWALMAGRDPAPYREWSRLLLDEGRTAAADTILRRAQRLLGSGRDFAMELGQLRAAMGLWEPAAASWREAVGTASYLHEAALFALAPAPAASRAAVLQVFMAPPIAVPARRVAASLALHWNAPVEAWEALRSLPVDDSVAVAWTDFAERAEASGSWLVARDALLAIGAFKPSGSVFVRAATDALNGHDYLSAVDLATRGASMIDSTEALAQALPVRVEALSALSRAAEAEALVRLNERRLNSSQRGRLYVLVARGWVRAGELARARKALAGASEDDQQDVLGWLALYEGDLSTARRALRRTEEQSSQAVLALAFLSRTRADASASAGAAFLALARGDTAGAALKLVEAAAELPDAAPLLLGESARLQQGRRDEAGAIRTWQILVDKHGTSPEAAEAELEWARALKRADRKPDAIARLEHLILTHPQSALVPQARRELDELRGATPRGDE